MGAHGNKCPTCGRSAKRSTEANRRYWSLLNLISEKLPVQKVTHSPETWHIYFKMRYLGASDVKLPNGKVLSIPASTADLDVSEFNDYMTKVEHWASEHGVWLDE